MTQSILPSSKNVFYHPLVRWEKVDEIVFLLEPHEHTQTREMIGKTLDHAVMTTVLEHLPREHHEEFLLICQDRFHDETVLIWLEERANGIQEKLRLTIQSTKAEIRTLLLES